MIPIALKPSFASYGGKTRIQLRPLVVFAVGSRQEVLGGRADNACRKRTLDLHLAALEILEESFGVFFFLICRFLKDGSDLDIAIVSGLTGKECIVVTGLRFTGKGKQQVSFSLRFLQIHDMFIPSTHFTMSSITVLDTLPAAAYSAGTLLPLPSINR